MTDAETAQLAINTIRTLSIDAVQAAISGHPGTPMALAPLVYTLLESGHAIRPARSDLAKPRSLRAVEWTCLDAALVRAPFEWRPGRQRGLRGGGEARGDARRHPALSSTREQGSRAPRVPLGVRRGDDDRTARAGHRHERWHGHRAEMAGGALQQARLRNLRLQRLYRVRRRLSDGGSRIGGRVARRPSRARQPLLGL